MNQRTAASTQPRGTPEHRRLVRGAVSHGRSVGPERAPPWPAGAGTTRTVFSAARDGWFGSGRCGRSLFAGGSGCHTAGAERGLGAVSSLEFVEDSRHVVLDGLERDVQ